VASIFVILITFASILLELERRKDCLTVRVSGIHMSARPRLIGTEWLR
jgi:hypothetical protein